MENLHLFLWSWEILLNLLGIPAPLCCVEGLIEKGVIENANLNNITYEELFTQFLASIVPISGSAHVIANLGSS